MPFPDALCFMLPILVGIESLYHSCWQLQRPETYHHFPVKILMKPHGVEAEKSMPDGLRINIPENSTTVKTPNGNVLAADKDGDNTGRPSVLSHMAFTKRKSLRVQ